MIEKGYFELENIFSDIKCNEYIITPNHIQFIIENVEENLCVRFNKHYISTENTNKHNAKLNQGEHKASPLRNVIQWFKTIAINEYIQNVKQNHRTPSHKQLWQRNYYEHIIRNANPYLNISNYIINNPSNWNNDIYFN